MSLNTNAAGFLILLGLVSGCGPLVPLSYDREHLQTNLAQTIESAEATITTEYLQLQNGYYVFGLEVINHSSDTIEFAPQTISFYASSKLFRPLTYPTDDVHAISAPNSKLILKRHFADSPWSIVAMYQTRAKDKQTASIFLAILAGGLIIYDHVQDSRDEQKETWTNKDAKSAAGRELLVNVSLTAYRVAQTMAYKASEDSYYIPYEIFPECKIEPGGSARGKVFVRTEASSYRYSRLVVPLAGIDYVFDFKRLGVKSSRR